MAVLTDEQMMLRDAAREWTRAQAPVSALRALRNSGNGSDPARVAAVAAMGWLGTIVPEAFDGSGLGYRGMGVLLEETGRTLAASPLLASGLVAPTALMLGGDPAQQREWLPRLASGELIGTLAVDEHPRHAPDRIETRAEAEGGTVVLSGRKTLVPEGMAAGLFVVAARGEGGIGLFLVPGDAAGLTRTRRHTVDSRDSAELRLDGVRLPAAAALTGGTLTGTALLDAVLDRARAGLAAEMLGIAVQAFETTLDYLKTRVQFGQPLGSFQALQHRMADMFTELELTRSTVEAALDAIDAASDDVPLLASLAKLSANETLHLVSRQMVQLHGGIGMTDEHDAGLYLKRAQVTETLYGNAAFHRERFGRLSGL